MIIPLGIYVLRIPRPFAVSYPLIAAFEVKLDGIDQLVQPEFMLQYGEICQLDCRGRVVEKDLIAHDRREEV